MIEILYRVKRVSHVNRVSSKEIAAADSAGFEVGKFFGSKLSDALFLSGSVALSALFFLFIILINTAWASSITTAKVVELANADRKNKGIQELLENEKLTQAAAEKADDMVLNDYFSHTSPQGTTPWHWIEKENYDYNYAGENLAMDFTTSEKMNEAWMASPTHRANILNEKYKEIGVAAKEGVINGHETIVVVQMFGSGDKNAPKEKKIETPNQSDYIPVLPVEEDEANKIAFAMPLITSPQEGEIFNDEKINVVGRANPQSKVTIFDGGVPVGDSASDEKGWFKLEIKNISEGSHSLTAATENISARKNENVFSEKISFRIDRERPSLGYHLYANGQKNNYLINLFSDKKNCYFELGGKKASVGSNGAVTFSVETRQSSIVATVSDQAGNKTKKQIILANYFAGSGKSFFEGLAFSFQPQMANAADSGREALAANLGIASRQLLSSR
ncbi:MAG: CAP domain-containing protein [Candidatus Moranbacteria bacterium]|nr:CAP domain-containing protein [Candidatus Moranbacteria bacterium]